VGLGTQLHEADASVFTVVASTDEFNSGTPVGIAIAGQDDSGILQIRASGADAEFTVVSCFVASVACETVDTNGNLDIDTATLESANTTQESLAMALTMTATCDSDVTIEVTATDNDSSASTIIDCNATGGNDPDNDHDVNNELLGLAQVIIRANPNILPCEGGTTTLTAEGVDAFGNVVPDLGFRFYTTAGTLVQTSDSTATLTLGPNQTTAEITASIPDTANDEIDEPNTFVNLDCNGTSDTQTLVVTASPNVVDCTGTTTITASVRDVNGHVVPGRGFHFVTSAGLLTVDPNNASTEEGVATLSLQPGDGDATVTVSSGLLHGTYEELDDVNNNYEDDEAGLVTVHQNCLGTTTGQIQVNSSAKTVACGENVFIGLSVIDENIQTVIDNTPLTLIATAGGFYGGEGTLLSAAQVPTTHGEANTIYTAPANFNGEVKITAASGDAYGFTKLNVTCVYAAGAAPTGSGTSAASSGGAAAPSAPSCTPIGDGVCVPNQITPPNTGDGGLK
jgi:hypothetical protein